ncbi:MAG: hypothetical protein ACREX4_06800 [Gammaproteobacteria bacterium]
MTNLDQIQSLSSEDLTLMQNKINKELEKRSGADIDVKKIRTQVYRLAKSLGCEWLTDSYPGDSSQEPDKPNKRAKKRKTEETAETALAIESKVQEPLLRAEDMRVEEEKRKSSLWTL